MKLYIKLLLAAVVLLAVVVPLFLTGPGGKPVMNVADWFPDADGVIGMVRQGADAGKALVSDSVDSLPGKEDDSAEEVARAPARLASESGKMYKWQDAQGRWHFSSEKPTETTAVSLESLPDVENVMDAPVDKDDKGSMMNPGEILEKLQRMAAERDQ